MQQSREEKGVSSTAEGLARLHFIEQLPKSRCDEGSPSRRDVVSYWRGTKEQTLGPMPWCGNFRELKELLLTLSCQDATLIATPGAAGARDSQDSPA